MLWNKLPGPACKLWLGSIFCLFVGLSGLACKSASDNRNGAASNTAPAGANKAGAGNSAPAVKNNLYGGIEIGAKGVKYTVIKVEGTADAYAGEAVLPIKTVNTTIMADVAQTGKFAPQAIDDTVAEIKKIYQKMVNDTQVAPERVFVIASSGLKKPDKSDVDNKAELAQKVEKAVSRKLEFLTPEDEVTFSIVGVIPIQERRRAMLMDVGSGSTKGGYREGTKDDPRFITMSIPYGTVSFTDTISKQAPDDEAFNKQADKLRNTLIVPALRQEMARKPGLVNRRSVYLSGGIVWAMATMMYPANRGAIVQIKPEDLAMFAYRARRNPEGLLGPNLAGIKDEKVRKEIEDDLQRVGETFTPKNLVAGAEILQGVARTCRFQKKRIYFARFASMGWLLKYVEYQAQEE